ncbi:hypothetical protein D3C75_989410 [compost metagenome]
MDRSIIEVEMGNSALSPAKPKKPPTPPLTATPALCQMLEDSSPGTSFIVNTAASRAFSNAELVMLPILLVTLSGKCSKAISMGIPIMLVTFAAKPGFSSKFFADCSSFRSSSRMLIYPYSILGWRDNSQRPTAPTHPCRDTDIKMPSPYEKGK